MRCPASNRPPQPPSPTPTGAGASPQPAPNQPWAPAPGQKTFGEKRKVIMAEMQRMTLLNLDKDITFEMARAATIKALEMPNTPASAASLRGLRPAISAIKREAPSELICIARNGILLLYPDFTHRVMYNKKKSPDLYEHAKVGCPHTLHVHTRSMCTHAPCAHMRGLLLNGHGKGRWWGTSGGETTCALPPAPPGQHTLARTRSLPAHAQLPAHARIACP